MGVLDYMSANYNILFELIGLLIILEISVHIPERMRRVAVWIIVLLGLETVIFYTEKWTQTFDGLSLLRPLLTAGVYSIYPLILMLTMQLNVDKKPPRWVRALIVIPELVSVPVFFTSQWTRLVCWYTEENAYIGGLFPSWPYILFFFYGAVFLIHNLRFYRNYARINRYFNEYVIIGPIIGMALYVALDNGMDYIGLFTSGIVLYFFGTYIHLAKIDPLTGLLNRQSYYQDMRIGEKTITAVASVDMNWLKRINDTQGHEAGDRALKAVSQVMRDNCGKNGRLYRIGGDEFIILYTNTNAKTMKDNVSLLRKRLAETEYSCAIGYAVRSKDETVNATVGRADHRMYENKEKEKAQQAKIQADTGK